MPKVSVLMATHNRVYLIEKTVKSILCQDFADWELIIADDGSTDNTKLKVESLKSKVLNLKYVRSEINQGISKNYNMGLGVACGEYVAMIDDDDPWIKTDKLSKQVEFLDKNKDYVGCGAGLIVVDMNGKELYRYLKPERDGDIRRNILFSNPMANSTTMFKLNVARELGLYDESIRYSGDRDFWLKMGLRGKLYNFPEYFSYYTMSGSNTSIIKMRPHLKTSLAVMKRYKGKYPNYYPALLFNWIQYLYSFVPNFVKKSLHYSLARMKRLVFG